MKKDKQLSEILKKKDFKNFWYCFEFLLLAGYPEKEAMHISMEEFNENSIYSSVAYITMYKAPSNAILRLGEYEKTGRPSILKVGFIDEKIIHLIGMFSVYRQWLISDKFAIWNKEIEDTCDKLRFANLSHDTLSCLLKLSKQHFGYEPFRILTPEATIFDLGQMPRQDLLIDMDEIRRQMHKLI